jgi:RAB protein geranylgeranyltransferase component A
LHVDVNDCYGGDDASFPLEQFSSRFLAPSPTQLDSENGAEVSVNEIPLVAGASAIHDVSVVLGTPNEDGSPALSATQLRRCIVDLWPRLLFARSPMIDTLVRSGVNRYLEFKCLQACFMLVPDHGLAFVPASKEQVFRDQTLSLLQKRSLMKLFSTIVAPADSDEFASLPQTGSFDSLLAGAKLSSLAAAFAKHAIALDPSPSVDDESSRARDIANCRRYAQSVGVYGATPFLASLYGTGELAQAYCRLAAVFGAIFIVQGGDVSLVRSDDATTLRALRCKEGVIAAKQFVIASALAPAAILRAPPSAPAPRARLHLCACVLSGSLLPASVDVQLPFIVVPPLAGRNTSSVYAIQLDPSMHVTMGELHMLYLWTRADDNDNGESASALFERVVTQLQPASNAPRVLWRAVWSRTVHSDVHESTFDNVHILGNGGGEVELDDAVRNAEKLFGKLCPGATFIERVPNPEDVDWSAPEEQQPQQQEQKQEEESSVSATTSEAAPNAEPKQ